jgi:hypothetical protein
VERSKCSRWQQMSSAFGGRCCVRLFCLETDEVSERATKPCCTPCQRKALNCKWPSGDGRAGASMHGMGAGNEVDSEAQNFWRAPKVAEMLR